MQLQQASRQQVKIRLGIQGPAGSGKTLGALMIAFGLCGDWSKIAVVDTESGSASLFSNVGKFYVVNLSAPFTPERYTEAMKLCAAAGVEVIVLDSISHEWAGNGGILDIHNALTGNSFTNWGKVTPRHNAFVESILQSTCHIIATIRSKQDYVLNDRNGKLVPEKVGLKGVQRNGLDYELTVLLEMDMQHNATSSKDRTNLFEGKSELFLTTATGQQLLAWCKQGVAVNPEEELIVKIEDATTVEELLKLYKAASPEHQTSLHEIFLRQRKKLEGNKTATTLNNKQNSVSNGQSNAVK